MSATCPEKVFEKYSQSCEGLPRIARQFIAGKKESRESFNHPAMNCRAIFRCPQGTKNA